MHTAVRHAVCMCILSWIGHQVELRYGSWSASTGMLESNASILPDALMVETLHCLLVKINRILVQERKSQHCFKKSLLP